MERCYIFIKIKIKIKIENTSGKVAGKEKLAWVQVVQIVNARLCQHP